MHATRPAAVAGQFYSDDASDLADVVDSFLQDHQPVCQSQPAALIAPHAGYIYSGAVAGKAFAELEPWQNHIDRVVLIGPAHHVRLRGMAVPRAGYFHTPLGDVTLDTREIQALSELPDVTYNDEAHAHEHSLEVQLPFLQRVLDDFHLVPVAVGQLNAQEVLPVLQRYWGKARTVIVISTDLSHYLDHDSAETLDALTAEAVADQEPERIGEAQACGREALQALLTLTRQHHAHVHQLALVNSGDTAGPRDRVVGYGAWAVEP